MILAAQALACGAARGEALVLSEPLSFWGGVDAATGEIIDRSHPERGSCVTGRILVMPSGRGSSSSASVLAEAIRRGTAPLGIVIERPDPILLVGALVAQALYRIDCPIVVCPGHGMTSGVLAMISAVKGDAAFVRLGDASPA